LKYGVNLLLLAGVIALGGCASLDPWREFNRLPASRSQAFATEAPEEEPVEAIAPGLARELTGRTLSVAECVVIALEQNPRTAESWEAMKATAAGAGEAKAEYLPSVGFTSSARRSDVPNLDSRTDQTSSGSGLSGTGDTSGSSDLPSTVTQSVISSVSKSIASSVTQAAVGGSDATEDPGPRNRYDVTFGVRWLVFDGGGREARVQEAAAAVLAAGFRHNTVLQDVVLSVEQAYYSLLAARSFEQVAVETVQQRDYQLRLAEARHRVGLVARSDVLKAQAEKAAADLDLVQATNAVRVARGRLVNAMGLRVSANFKVAESPERDRPHELADIESLLSEAANNRPELKTAQALVRLHRARVREAESRYWPSLAVDTSAGWIGRSFPPDLRQWGIGVVLDLPLFTGFDRAYQLRGSETELARAVAEYQIVLREVELEVWTAYWQALEAEESIEAAERFVASAEESARVAEGEYKNGTGSIIGLIDAQTARTVAKDRLIQARLDWRMAKARFEYAVGRSLTQRAEPLALEESE